MKKIYKNLRTIRTALMLLCTGLLLLAANAGFGQADVITDKDDYFPGETVIISGSGWEAGETVELYIEHLFYVTHYDQVIYVTADEDGKIYDESYKVDISDLGEFFLLTATGQSSGLVAYTEFSDAIQVFPSDLSIDQTGPISFSCVLPGPLSASLSTCSTGQGGGNTDYVEITYKWYYNTTNSNILSSAIEVQSNDSHSDTISDSYTPENVLGTRYYFCVVEFTAKDNGDNCGGTEQADGSREIPDPAHPENANKSTFKAWYVTNPIEVSVVPDNEAPQLVGSIPVGATNMNLCYSDMPVGPTTDDIKAEFTDNCGVVNVDKTTQEAPENDDCAWSVTYTYDVYDDAGNHVDPSPTVTYSGSDQTAPSLTTTPFSDATEYDACMSDAQSTVPEWTEVNAITGYSDNCGQAVSASLDSTRTTGDDCDWTVTYYYTVFDECLNPLEVQSYV
uniref:hypothetical protein n=1 Tax=Maribellus sediminis TaxID=2696285 RepID=UPI001430F4FF